MRSHSCHLQAGRAGYCPTSVRHVVSIHKSAAAAGFQLAVHAGAQTTADTVAIAAHARERGADAVAVIGPPYFALDDEELFRHFRSAADACSPLPFYVYEFEARTGYAVPVSVVTRLREHASNLRGRLRGTSPSP